MLSLLLLFVVFSILRLFNTHEIPNGSAREITHTGGMYSNGTKVIIEKMLTSGLQKKAVRSQQEGIGVI